jgi:CRISP-associated protein Cas1
MGVLYIDRKDVELRADAARILVYEQGYQTSSVPLHLLDRVVIAATARLDTRVLGTLAEHNVALVVLNARKPQRTALLVGRAHNAVARRVGQYCASLDEDFRVAFSRAQVVRKLVAQKRLLSQAISARPDQRYPLTTAVQALQDRLSTLRESTPTDRDRIRGVEGAAAAAYFKGLTTLFPPSLDFTHRNRRPPRDPVNACLSLGYTLMHSEAVQALHGAGLDPMIGFYHDLAFGRESLACDLIEPLRPRVDEWVWRLFQTRQLRVEYFSQDKGACLLGKEGRSIYYRCYEGFLRVHRRYLRRVAFVLAKGLASKAPNVDVVDNLGPDEQN